jgi:glycosyltransferase involved in cell wall biosynthesis
MSESRNRIRVLLLAEACNPTWTSVPLVGYNFARALADREDLDITLVTHIKNRNALANDPICKRVRLHIIDNEWLARPMYHLSTWLRGGEKLAWTLNTALAWPGHIAFEQTVARDFAQQLRRREFDLIHRVTPLTPTIPSPLASRTSVPMILGPLNGGLPWPREFPELIAQEREWLTRMRGCYRLLPYFRSTYKNAAAVIAGSHHTAREIPQYFRGAKYYLPENGIDLTKFPLANGWTPPASRFQFVTVGRLVPYKGVMLTLEAFASSPVLRKTKFLIIGDGPQREELEQYIRAQQLNDAVRLIGFCEQRELTNYLRTSQAFVFPSLREFGGGVVLEAMASGLPSVIVNYGGPAELVNRECAVLLPLQPRQELVANLRLQLEQLVEQPDLCRAMSNGAVNRVQSLFTWDVKANALVQIYRDVLSSSHERAIHG